MQVPGDGRRSRSAATSASSTWLISIEERRKAVEPGGRAGLAHEPRQVVAGLAVAEAAEVDSCVATSRMALLDARRRISASTAAAARLRDSPRTSGITQKPHENEQPSWISDEGADAVEPGFRLHVADRARHSPATKAALCSGGGRATTVTFGGQAGEGVSSGGRRRSR